MSYPNSILVLILLFGTLSCFPKISKKSRNLNPTELAAINQTIEKVFAAITFEKGSPPNMYQLESLFIKEGLLINRLVTL